jgi:putative cell wall-binding protein
VENLRLGPLASNDGPTQTHALLAGSVAIDAATDSVLATDQRGVTRPQGAARDVGAFEYVAPVAVPGPSFSRVEGADRYATAAAVSAATFAPGVDTVFIVTGDDYPDGLTAGAIAGSLEVPVLLVRTGSIPTATASELTRLAPGEIVVVGGPSVIDDSVVTALDEYTDGTVARIFGADRFATAAALSAEYVAPGVDEVYIATGADFADALTAAAAAGANDAPVLLVSPTSVPTATATELTRLAPDRITVIGGPSAISPAAETALDEFTTGPVTRVFGPDRYGTAAAVSAHAFTRAATVHLATGLTFPDALAAGPAAAMAPGPILLSRTTCIPAVTDTEIDRLGATRVVLLGGTTALAAPVAAGTTCP